MTQKISSEQLPGEAGLIRMIKVNSPWSVSVLGQELTLIDDGYCWLQIAPEGINWWLTVMFDRKEKLIQYYFDITLQNTVLPEGNSYFEDLFLDIVLTPEHGMVLLDEDELEQALTENVIDETTYRLSKTTATELMKGLLQNEKKLEGFCRRQMEELKAKLADEPDGE